MAADTTDDDSTDYDVPTPNTLVRVTSLDGETSGGEVVAVHDTPAEDYLLFEDDDAVETVSIYEFWGRGPIARDEPVVTVQLSGGKYDYPVSKVREVEEGEADV